MTMNAIKNSLKIYKLKMCSSDFDKLDYTDPNNVISNLINKY